MTEREKLVFRLRALWAVHRAKQLNYQEEYKLGPEVGCITKEATLITGLMPKIWEFNIKPEEYE